MAHGVATAARFPFLFDREVAQADALGSRIGKLIQPTKNLLVRREIDGFPRRLVCQRTPNLPDEPLRCCPPLRPVAHVSDVIADLDDDNRTYPSTPGLAARSESSQAFALSLRASEPL